MWNWWSFGSFLYGVSFCTDLSRYSPASMSTWTPHGLNVGYLGTEWAWAWTGQILQVPHGFSKMGPTCDAHVGWLNGPLLSSCWFHYMGLLGSHPIGPHLKPSQNPLEAHMGKHRQGHHVNCRQTHVCPYCKLNPYGAHMDMLAGNLHSICTLLWESWKTIWAPWHPSFLL